MMKRLVWMLMCYPILGTSVYGASFDCAKAATNIEKLICSDTELSKLDEELSTAYKTALQDEKQGDSIRQTQKLWMKERNGCFDYICVKRAYEKRLSLLLVTHSTDKAEQNITSLAQGGGWRFRDGAGSAEVLCQELLKRLNSYDRDESLDNRCSFPVIASYPKFSAPPWEDLDLAGHEELLVKLMKYSGEDPVGYFHLRSELKQRNPDSYYRERVERFIQEGGRLRIWRTRLVNHFGTGPIIPAPPGGQTIVQLFIPKPKDSQDTYCVGKPKPVGVNSLELLFIVSADLRGPDPNVDRGMFGILGGRDLVMYEGKPLVIGSEDIWYDGALMLNRYCDFEFVKGEK